jgi:uncharacterized membrane-anchored protein
MHVGPVHGQGAAPTSFGTSSQLSTSFAFELESEAMQKATTNRIDVLDSNIFVTGLLCLVENLR